MKTYLVRQIRYRKGKRVGKYVKVKASSKKAALTKYLQRRGWKDFSIKPIPRKRK